MPALTFEYAVEMDDGTKHRITVDQRDLAAFEEQEFGCSYTIALTTKLFTMMRFVAWHALTRTKAIKMDWQSFKRDCVEVVDADGLIEVDPTKSDQPEGA